MVKVQRLFAKTNLKIRVCEAMRAPVGLLSDRTVCESRWRGLAPTSSSLSYTFPAGFGVGPRLRSNKSPSGAFERPNDLALARWRGVAPTSSVGFAIKGIMDCGKRQDGFANFIAVKRR